MTLGGMALAVGILVDDATVEIENIHRNLHQGKHLVKAILDGAQQIAVPAFVSTLCICIVFVPVVFITGAAKSLFTPLAMAVVFAMLTSYLLSRTLVPTMVHYLLAREVRLYGGQPEPEDQCKPVEKNSIWRFHEAFDRQFERLRAVYGRGLAWALAHRKAVVAVFSGLVVVSIAMVSAGRRGLLPDGRFGANPPARPRSGRYADRGDRALFRPGDRSDSPAHSAPRSENGDRQHRHSQ